MKLGSFFARYGTAAALGAALALFLSGSIVTHRKEQKKETQPRVLQATKLDRTAEREDHDCGDLRLVTLAPTRQEVEKLAREWGLYAPESPRSDERHAPAGVVAVTPDGAPERILAEKIDSLPAPAGVQVLSTLDELGNNVLRVQHLPRPWAELGGDWSFYAEKGMSSWGDYAMGGALYDAGRLGRTHLGANIAGGQASNAGGFWMVGVRLSWE